MPLNLYRRHRKDCEAGRAEDSTTGEFTERQRSFGKRCACVIFVSGTLGGRFSRKRTGATTWEVANAYAAALERAGSWTGTPQQTPQVLETAAAERITVAEAICLYLENRKATVAPPTLRKYATFTKQLQTFADTRGYVCLDQFRPDDIDRYFTGSDLGPISKAKMLDWLRAFWRFAVNRLWITRSPVSSDLKPPTGATRGGNKVPFTDEQLADILKACDRFNDYAPSRWGNRFGAGEWTGEDLKDFIWFSIHTGLRISDVVLFDIERLHGNEVFLRAKKNGGDVFAYVPDWLRERLRARAKRCGVQPFMISKTKRLDTVTNTWRKKLGKVFEAADIGNDPGTPHRFRHTYARILLQKGVSVAAVADLMGDTEVVIRRHYSRWVPERQAALTAILKDAFCDNTHAGRFATPAAVPRSRDTSRRVTRGSRG